MYKFFGRGLTALLSAAVFLSSQASIGYNDIISAETELDKLIALTFDDGPNTTTTNDVLDVLEEYGAVGSFFLIGDNINEESALSVKRAYDMGCEIDNHSKTHSNMPGMTEEEMLAEINYVNEWVYDITGEYPSFFRPPFIATNDLMYEVIELPFISGMDCKDFMADVTAQQRADAIISAAKDGLIVLLHDAAGNDQTVEALKTVIPTLQAQGYEFVTLNELFERQGETPRGDIIYSEVAKYPCSDYSLYKEIFSGEASGDSSWDGWSNTAAFDGAELEALGDSFAIEIEYQSVNPPVLTLQAWSNGNSLWSPVNAAYYNGERACILAEDVVAAVEASGLGYTDLDKITVRPYGGEMTVTKVNLLVKNQEGVSKGVSAEEIADFLLGRIGAKAEFDVNFDGIIDSFDLVAARQAQ